MSSRRDAGRPRGKPIEHAIVAATLDELARHGLEGLSIPRVAAAADVNKTTVYRRWPTREALVAAALEAALHETAGSLTDTGSLRGDVHQLLDRIAARMSSPEGRALARAALADAAATAVHTLGAAAAAEETSAVVALVQRAAARGEWDLARHAPDAVLALVAGAVMHRVMMERQPVSAAWTTTVADVIVRGLAPRPPVVVLRPAAALDAPALAALGRATFIDTFVVGFGIPYPPDDLEAYLTKAFDVPTLAARFVDPREAWWVVERDGTLLAFANVGPNGLPHPDARSTHAELRRLYVAKEAQGLGLGTRLLDVALAWMEAHTDGPLWIGVWSGNHKARRLYEARGFRMVGEYRFPVGSWTDEDVILRRG